MPKHELSDQVVSLLESQDVEAKYEAWKLLAAHADLKKDYWVLRAISQTQALGVIENIYGTEYIKDFVDTLLSSDGSFEDDWLIPIVESMVSKIRDPRDLEDFYAAFVTTYKRGSIIFSNDWDDLIRICVAKSVELGEADSFLLKVKNLAESYSHLAGNEVEIAEKYFNEMTPTPEVKNADGTLSTKSMFSSTTTDNNAQNPQRKPGQSN